MTNLGVEVEGEQPAAPRAVVDPHLRKLVSWLVLLDFNIDMIFLQLGAMNKEDKEHHGLTRKSMKYKMRYLRSSGIITQDEYRTLERFRKDRNRLLHDKAERMSWIASESEAKRQTIENAEKAIEISRDAMLRLPQQLRWN